MRENNIKTIWEQNGAVVNGWLATPSSVTAEVMAQLPWDSLTIDLQHGLVDYQDALLMMQAISTTDIPPMVRAPWLEPGIIGKLLDAGAYGIICPMINTREEAEALVAATRYAPIGMRSVGPMRAAMYAGLDYIAHANETIVVLAMIETSKALANLEDIVTTPGLDGVYIGPGDLSLSLGFEPQLDPLEPDVLEAVETIREAARNAGLRAGIHCAGGANAQQMIAAGFDFVSLSTDSHILAAAAAVEINKARG